MRHRVAPLTALALFFLYLVGRIAIVMQGKVFTSFDTFSYAYRNDPQWDRGALVSFIGDAPRPWGVPLFFALFPDDQSRAIGQWVVGTVAWALLAWTLYSLLRHPLAKVLSVGAILLLGLLRPVASWDFAILSESLSISLGVLTLALFLWWLRHRAWWTLAAMVLVAIWWMFTRVDIFVLVLPLAAVLAVLAWRNRDSPQARNAALAGGAVLAVAAAFSYLVVGPSSMKAHERWSFTPELNQETGLTMYRLRLSVFPDPEVKSFFEAELGMPKCDAADRVAAGPEWDIEAFSRAVAACPSLREWVEQHRQGLWTDYATGAPGPFVRQIAQLTSDALTGAAYAHVKRVQLVHLAHARSGDKGDTANVGVIAYDPAHYALLRDQLTPERVKAHFGDMVKGDVERFELPKLGALNFLLHGALGGGGTMSLMNDAQGKVFSTALLRIDVEVPYDVAKAVEGRGRVPAGWSPDAPVAGRVEAR
jgi:hypothetical protein